MWIINGLGCIVKAIYYIIVIAFLITAIEHCSKKDDAPNTTKIELHIKNV